MESVLTEFLALSPQIRSESTRAQYRRAVRWLGESLGRPAKLADLSDNAVIRTLVHLTTVHGQSPTTANTSHKCLCSLWRWCHNQGLLSRGPTVAPLPEVTEPPDSWSDEQMVRLLTVAAACPYRLSGVPGGTWWRALLALELATLERAGALLSSRWEWIDWRASALRVPAVFRKGGLRGEVYSLPTWCVDAVRDLREAYSEPLPATVFDCKPAAYYRRWDALLDAAELPAGRRNKTHKIRRTMATLAVLARRDPMTVLRQKTPGMAYKHYVDPSRTVESVDSWIPAALPASLGTGNDRPLGIS
jgi:integrase